MFYSYRCCFSTLAATMIFTLVREKSGMNLQKTACESCSTCFWMTSKKQ